MNNKRLIEYLKRYLNLTADEIILLGEEEKQLVFSFANQVVGMDRENELKLAKQLL